MKKTLIITGANTAREIGTPMPIEENCTSSFDYGYKLTEWKLSESSLKEYRITAAWAKTMATQKAKKWSEEMIKDFPIGSKVECEVNDQDLTCVIL